VTKAALAAALRAAFWIALAACTVLALWPVGPHASVDLGGAVRHFAAFATLTFLARVAFRERSGWTVGIALIGYGALLEVLQGLGGVRLAEWGDLGMDVVGVAVGLAIHALMGSRALRFLNRLGSGLR
jgi:hypothetical protein